MRMEKLEHQDELKGGRTAIKVEGEMRTQTNQKPQRLMLTGRTLSMELKTGGRLQILKL